MNDPMPVRVRLLLAGLCCLFASSASAQRMYDVEIIIFSHNDGTDQGETWQRPVGDAGRTTGQFNKSHFTELSSSRYRLGPARYSLQHSGKYSVLYHRAWRQVASSVSNPAAYPVHSFSNDSSTSVEGTVRLVRGRHLHLEIDLLLMNAAGASPGQYSDGPGNTPAFRLREKRRIKSSELHYFDHPRFGLIAMVTPYRAPKPAPVETSGNETSPAAEPVTTDSGENSSP